MVDQSRRRFTVPTPRWNVMPSFGGNAWYRPEHRPQPVEGQTAAVMPSPGAKAAGQAPGASFIVSGPTVRRHAHVVFKRIAEE